MPKLTCGCLNVKVYVKKTENKIVNVAQLGIGADVTEEFFSLNIAEAHLDLEGIIVEQSALLRHRTVSEWVITQCVNCQMLTHATHGDGDQANSKLLINLSLKSDQTIIERLEKSPDFSPVYKVVLQSSTNDNQHPSGMLGLQTDKYEQVTQTLTTIQQQLTKYLENEKIAMEDRIRQFEDQQRQAFAALESKVRRDKNALVSLVLVAQEPTDSTTDRQPPASPHSPLGNPGHRYHTGAGGDVSDGQLLETLPAHIGAPTKRPAPRGQLQQQQQQRQQQQQQRPHVVMRKRHDDDDEDLFDLDEENDDDEEARPFYVSDDDNDDTDDSSLSEEPTMRGRIPSRNVQRNVYSSSVPISMPNNWRMASMHASLEEEDDDDRTAAPDPANMAASIKALARSVHGGDGTEIFGDLPRRRFNAMEKR